MKEIMYYLLLGISLSIDTFSLSLSLGTIKLSKNIIIKSSLLVALFHFIMPLIGSTIGIFISSFLTLPTNYLSSIIFLALALEIYFHKEDIEKIKNLKLITLIILSLSVSIDSLSLGIVMGLNSEKVLVASIIFSIVSSSFTYLGFILGEQLTKLFKNKASVLGSIFLLLLSLKYLLLK